MLLNIATLLQIATGLSIVIRHCNPIYYTSHSTTALGLSGTMIFFNFGFFCIFLFKLFFLHCWLACNNITFYEYVKNKFTDEPGGNPYYK